MFNFTVRPFKRLVQQIVAQSVDKWLKEDQVKRHVRLNFVGNKRVEGMTTQAYSYFVKER